MSKYTVMRMNRVQPGLTNNLFFKNGNLSILNNQIINPSGLNGLELAKYVLLRLVNDHESIETIAEDFDDDQRFISGVVDFLDDIDWIRQDMNGVYRITTRGKNGMITRQRPLVSFT